MLDAENQVCNVKNFRIHISVFMVLSAAFAGYYYFGDFGLQETPVTITDFVEPVTKQNPETQVAQKESRPETEKTSSSTQQETALSKSNVKVNDVNETQVTAESKKPSFDVVRVEPSGDTLIAGQAAPNSKVLIEKNGKVIAETTTDAAGAFVALPSDAIQGENNQVVIRSVEADGTESVSNQVVAIGVPEIGEPLVALVVPGKAIEILQKPKAQQSAKVVPQKEDQLQVAAKDQSVITPSVETPAKGETSAEPSTAQDVPVEKEEVVDSEQTQNTLVTALESKVKVKPDAEAVEAVAEKAQEATRRVARLLKPEETSGDTTTTSGITPDAAIRTDRALEDQNSQNPPKENGLLKPAGEQDSAALAPHASSAELETSATDSGATTDNFTTDNSAQAGVNSEQPQKTKTENTTVPSLQAPIVSVEAVEVDGEKIFIAGEATAGETIRVYVDGENIGDVKVAGNGRWLYEDKKNLKPGQYTIRVDQITTASGRVDARAEVPFLVEDRTVSELASAESNTIIIRRNDNLWTIAQRLYGDGLRFTAIYEQNRDQIRDPDLIFPGQTFTLPAGQLTAQPQN